MSTAAVGSWGETFKNLASGAGSKISSLGRGAGKVLSVAKEFFCKIEYKAGAMAIGSFMASHPYISGTGMAVLAIALGILFYKYHVPHTSSQPESGKQML